VTAGHWARRTSARGLLRLHSTPASLRSPAGGCCRGRGGWGWMRGPLRVPSVLLRLAGLFPENPPREAPLPPLRGSGLDVVGGVVEGAAEDINCCLWICEMHIHRQLRLRIVWRLEHVDDVPRRVFDSKGATEGF